MSDLDIRAGEGNRDMKEASEVPHLAPLEPAGPALCSSGARESGCLDYTQTKVLCFVFWFSCLSLQFWYRPPGGRLRSLCSMEQLEQGRDTQGSFLASPASDRTCAFYF